MTVESFFKTSDIYYKKKPYPCWSTKAYHTGKRTIFKSYATRNEMLESVKSSIAARISTQRFSEPIYTSSYGIDWNSFIGRTMDQSLASELIYEVESSVRCEPNITSVNVYLDTVGIDTYRIYVEATVSGLGKLDYETTVGL